MDVGNLLITAIVALVQPILDFITNHTDTIMELVFNYNIEKNVATGEVINAGMSDKIYGLFTRDELTSLIKPGVDGMQSICALLLLLGVIYYGVRLSRQGSNERLRSENMSMLFTLVFSMFLLHNIWSLYDMMFLLNNVIVSTFRGMAFSKLGGADFTTGAEDTSSAILALVLSIMMVGLSLWANFFYIMRKLMIIMLMITGPVFITLSIFPQMRQVTSTWARELFSNIISQAIHAMMLWIFIVMSNSTTGWLIQIVFLATFIPISEAIKALIGASGETNTMAVGSSISAIAGAAALSGSIAGKVGVNSDISSLMSRIGTSASSNFGSPRVPSGGPTGANGSGYSPAASSYMQASPGQGTYSVGAQPLTNSRTMNQALRAGRNVGRIAGSIGSATGALALAPLGPGGMMFGASLGRNIMSTGGTLAGRGGSIAAQVGLQGVKGGISQVYKDLKPGGAISQAGQQSSEGTRRVAQVAAVVSSLGRGTAIGMGIKGGTENVVRNAAAHAAGIAFGEEQYNLTYQKADSLLRNVTRPTLSELKDKVASGEIRKNMKVIQTNEGTYLTGFVRDKDGKYRERQRISRIAEANPALKDGQSIELDARIVDGGRLVIDESNMRFRDTDNKVRKTEDSRGKQIVDTAYAKSKYTQVEASDFFQEKFPEIRGKRTQRDNHSKWLQKNRFGGKK